MGSIYLIRHAQASFGAQDYDVLSPLGYRQAEALGDYLAQLGIRFDRCISGELHRQQDTARTTLARLDRSDKGPPSLEIDAAFNEFQADAVIRAHLPELLEVEPNALHILRNAASHRAEFQRLFTFVRAPLDFPANMKRKNWKAGAVFSNASPAVWSACSSRPKRATRSPSSRPAAPLPRCCSESSAYRR